MQTIWDLRLNMALVRRLCRGGRHAKDASLDLTEAQVAGILQAVRNATEDVWFPVRTLCEQVMAIEPERPMDKDTLRAAQRRAEGVVEAVRALHSTVRDLVAGESTTAS